MKFFDWFKPKNKKNIVLPSEALGPLQGAELIKAFSTEDEPKCKDFPKEKYSVYWEMFVEAVPGGYGCLLRFYKYKGGLLKEHQLFNQNINELRQEVSKLIRSTMESNRV